jgi:hypothetical protein
MSPIRDISSDIINIKMPEENENKIAEAASTKRWLKYLEKRFKYFIELFGEDALNSEKYENHGLKYYVAVENALTAQDSEEGIYYPEGCNEARWRNFKHEKYAKMKEKREKERERQAKLYKVYKVNRAAKKEAATKKNEALRKKYAEKIHKNRSIN